MEKENLHPDPRQVDYQEDEINLVDLIYPVYKRRTFLITFCILVVAAVAFISIKMEKTYQATAVILPEAKETGGAGELKAAFLEQFGVAGLGGSAGTSAEMFEAVLNSKELARSVARRYDYSYVRGIGNRDEKAAVGAIAGGISVTRSRKEPTLSVSFRANDPIMASDLANTYIIALDEYNRSSMVTSAQRLRKYIEKRLAAANGELEEAQDQLRKFQEQNRAISISKQAEATLEVLSELEQKRVALEVEKAAKEKFFRGPHIEIEQLNAQMKALQKNLDRLTYSEEGKIAIDRGKGKVEFYIPLTHIPSLSFDESRLLLNVKAKTGVVTMLTTQLEQAKLDEAKDMPTINVLDWAVAPERPIKPKLKLNLILGIVVALFVGIFLVFIMEFSRKMDEDPETSPRWREIKSGLLFFGRKNKEE